MDREALALNLTFLQSRLFITTFMVRDAQCLITSQERERKKLEYAGKEWVWGLPNKDGSTDGQQHWEGPVSRRNSDMVLDSEVPFPQSTSGHVSLPST